MNAPAATSDMVSGSTACSECSEAKATKRPAGEQYPRNSSFHHHGISELTHRDWYTGHVKCSKASLAK
jgi:hypothetical protein